MNIYLKSILFWTPRVFTLFFAIFLSLFALDVFNSGYPLWKIPIALFMHLIPVFIILGVLLLSWKWEWVGGIVYIVLGFYYLLKMWNGRHIETLLIISLPLFILGILFLIGWLFRKDLADYKKELFTGRWKFLS